MEKFFILYQAPIAEIEKWMKKPEAERKEGEAKMMKEWDEWMKKHQKSIHDKGAGVGKTLRVTKDGVHPAKNDVMLYGIVEAKSREAAAEMFKDHPHLQIPHATIEVMTMRAMRGNE